MAYSDKNIVIYPNVGSSSADPKVVFSGADASTPAQSVTLQVYPTNGGTISFEGSAGQLFSISNNLTGTLFAVNDISGIPSVEVLDSGLVKIAQYSGNCVLGTGIESGAKLQVSGAAQTDNPTLGSAVGAGLFVTNTDPRYGLMIGVSGSGYSWAQVGRSDGTATVYDLRFQTMGGNVAIGNIAANTKLHVVGAISTGQNTNGTAVIDAYGGYAYYGCNSATSGIKIDGSGFVSTNTVITVFSASYPSSFPSTLSVGSGADGKLQLGNNSNNEIIGGSTTGGGYLRFWTNNTSYYASAPNGKLALTLTATGSSIFTETLNISTSISGNYNEGIRISKNPDGYAGIFLGCDTSGSNVIGTQWSILHNPSNNIAFRYSTADLITFNTSGNITASSFSGDGSGLTGTASSLTAGIANNANALGGNPPSNFVQGINNNRTTSDSNFNAWKPSGFYDYNSATGAPTASWYHMINSAHDNSGAGNLYQFQITTEFWNQTDFYMRSINPSSIGPWRRLLHFDNIANTGVPIGGTSGTFSSNIYLTGNGNGVYLYDASSGTRFKLYVSGGNLTLIAA